LGLCKVWVVQHGNCLIPQLVCPYHGASSPAHVDKSPKDKENQMFSSSNPILVSNPWQQVIITFFNELKFVDGTQHQSLE